VLAVSTRVCGTWRVGSNPSRHPNNLPNVLTFGVNRYIV